MKEARGEEGSVPQAPARGWLPAALAALLALAMCGWLALQAAESRWVLDADEAVHAVEALRRFDRLEHGELGTFLVESYFPERWQPPVQDHVRWYGIVHSWSILPSFFLLGPSDFSVRLPSLLYLLGSFAVIFLLARSLAPRHGDWAGLAAVALLLSAPNVLTFAPQSLTEACVFFWCYATLYAYVGFARAPESLGRALLTGALLAVSLLAKYDHGLLMFACLGLAETVRARGDVVAMLRSRVVPLFAVPTVVFGLWLAHPEKWAAFQDALSHPAYGSWRVIAANVPASLLLEYTSSLAGLALLSCALFAGLRPLRDPALRGVWIYAMSACLLLVVRARFQFRYHLVEVPALLVLAGALLPSWIEGLDRGSNVRRRLPGLAAAGLAAALLSAVGVLWARPDVVHGLFEAVLTPLLAAASLGLSRTPPEYAAEFTGALTRVLLMTRVSLLAGAAALALLACWWLRSAGPGSARRWWLGALALSFLPGTFAFWTRLPGMVRWEWEGSPALHGVLADVARHSPREGTLLLGGGWDQLTNNTLAWHLKTTYLEPRPRYDDLRVVGDMIGSLVLPEEPRVEHWAEVLRSGGADALPERVVLLEPRDDFLYREVVGPECDLYRAILEQRGGYERVHAASFEDLGLGLEIWARGPRAAPPLDAPTGAAARGPLTPSGRVTEGRWRIGDKAWRHLDSPWLQ